MATNWNPNQPPIEHHRADVGLHQRARAEDPQPDERGGGALLDCHEGGQERRHPDERDQRSDGAPADGRRFDDGEHEQQHRGGQRHRPDRVERAPEAVHLQVTRHEADAGDQRREGDGHGQEEHPAPADLGQQAAEHESEREPGGARRRVDRDRAVPDRAFGEARRDDRQACGRRERGAHALDEPRGDQQRAVVDESAERRGDDEDAERDQEHTPPAEQVGRPAAEEEEAAVTEHVRAHHPLQRTRREAEVFTDRRKGDADHRDVHGVEEECAAEDEQHAPGTCCESLPLGLRCRRECHAATVAAAHSLVPERVYPGISATCLSRTRIGILEKWPLRSRSPRSPPSPRSR